MARARFTKLGDMPTRYIRPSRSTLVWLILAAFAYWALLVLSLPDEPWLDAQFMYSAGYALGSLDGLDDSERASYQVFAIADGGFILVYTAMVLTWVRFLRNRSALPRALHPLLALVPGVLDAIETGSIATLVQSSPVSPEALVWAPVFATPLKWLAGVAMAGAIVWGESKWFRAKRARRRAAAQVTTHRG